MNDSVNHVLIRRAAFSAATAALDVAHSAYMTALGKCIDATHSQDAYARASEFMHRIESDLNELRSMMRTWSRP